MVLVTPASGAWAEAPKCKGTKRYYKGKCRYQSEIKKLKTRGKQSTSSRPGSDIELIRFWAPFLDGTVDSCCFRNPSRSPKSGFPRLDAMGEFVCELRHLSGCIGLGECIKRYHGLDVKIWVSTSDLIKMLVDVPWTLGRYEEVFERYNPKALRKLFQLLIPETKDHSAHLAARRVYIRLFRSITRLYALNFVFLQERDGGLKRQGESFKKLIYLEAFHCPQWTKDRYAQAFSVFSMEVSSFDQWILTSFGPANDDLMCFWLRRQLGGSAETIAAGIGQLLRRYDEEFVSDYASKMKHFPRRFP